MDKTPSLQYSARGTGMPVVLVHGFPLDRRMWNSVAQSLSLKYRVITPDLPGFGKSDLRAATDKVSIEYFADSLRRFLSDLNLFPCVLGGLSMGGYTALVYARKYPQSLAGLMLLDTRAEDDTADGKKNRDAMIALVRAQGSVAVADQMLPKLLRSGADAAVREELKAIMDACPAKTIEFALAAMRDREDEISRLPGIAVPTLIIVGDQDAITPPAMAEHMHRGIKQSKLVIIKDAGHMTPMEQPAQVNEAIDQFLQTLSPFPTAR